MPPNDNNIRKSFCWLDSAAWLRLKSNFVWISFSVILMYGAATLSTMAASRDDSVWIWLFQTIIEVLLFNFRKCYISVFIWKGSFWHFCTICLYPHDHQHQKTAILIISHSHHHHRQGLKLYQIIQKDFKQQSRDSVNLLVSRQVASHHLDQKQQLPMWAINCSVGR